MAENKPESSFELMKNQNRRKVYNIIIEKAPISRSEIAKNLGFNKMTVTNAVNDLMERGLVCERGKQPNSVGRPSLLVELDSLYGAFIGVEINAFATKLLVTDVSGKVVEKSVITKDNYDPEVVLDGISDFVRHCQESHTQFRHGIVGIGIALPGNYNYSTGVVEYISTMPCWSGYPVRKMAEERIPDIPIYFQNTCRAGAKGEQDFGKARRDEAFIYIHGTGGLTVSLYTKRGFHVGDRGFSGRFGHMIVENGGRLCSCGNRGCLEPYASLYAITHSLYPGKPTEYSMIEEVFSRKSQQDSAVLTELDHIAQYLSIGIANLVNCFNPPQIYIGGYLGMLLDGYEEVLNRNVNQYLPRHLVSDTRIRVSALGDWGSAFGGISTIRSHLIS